MRNSASSAPASSSKTPCCTKVGLKRGPWKPEEDELLANYINKEGEGRWRTLPKRAGLLRCGKSCRLRWMNYLRPSVKRGQIAPDEEDLILRLHRLLGNRWSLIAGRIPGRTDNEIKNYWNTHLSKKLISQGIDPRTHKPLNPNPNSTSDIVHVPAPKVSKPNFNHNPNPNPSLHTTGLEEITHKGKECFKRRHLDQDALLVVGDGDEDWQNSDGLNSDGLNSDGLMMDSQGNSNEEDDTNYCTDDVFSSFLNSLINEDVFVNQQQLQQQQPMGIAPSDPLVPSGQTLGYGVVWEAALTSSTAAAFNEDEHKRFVGRQ